MIERLLQWLVPPKAPMRDVPPMEVPWAYDLAKGPTFLMIVSKQAYSKGLARGMGEALQARGINAVIIRADLAPIIYEMGGGSGEEGKSSFNPDEDDMLGFEPPESA
jgi:hypothetical protein